MQATALFDEKKDHERRQQMARLKKKVAAL
jgi:hypothetical protein